MGIKSIYTEKLSNFSIKALYAVSASDAIEISLLLILYQTNS